MDNFFLVPIHVYVIILKREQVDPQIGQSGPCDPLGFVHYRRIQEGNRCSDLIWIKEEEIISRERP